MATPQWEPGKLYAPGSLVLPRSNVPGAWPALTNASFEVGDLTDWDILQTGAGTASVSSIRPYTAPYAGRWTGAYGGTGQGGGTFCVFLHTARGYVRAGQSVTVSAQIAQDDTSDSQNFGAVRIYWFDGDDNPIASRPYSEASRWVAGNYSNYEFNSVTAQAPAGAVYARAGIWLNANGEGGMWVDNVAWSSVVPPLTAGLQYKAVQPAIGASDTVEPAWPATLGLQVIDNEVIWEAVLLTRVVWQARSVLRSGAVEPEWPEVAGTFVADNTISWQAVSRRVEDERCPNTKQVIIASSKVLAGDGDIIRYSATVNPLDWSTPDDAGYLPFGLNLYGANPVAAMGLYRGNLVAGNAQGTQVWQLSEDPQEMALLDAFPIGTTFHEAMAPVSNDMLMLTQLGSRSIGIAGASVNLQADEIGMPIDPLVQEAVAHAEANGYDPIGVYHPSLGQYLLAFPSFPEADQTTCFVLTLNAKRGKWSRYVYPFAIECFCQHGNDLLIRAGDLVCVVDKDIATDATAVWNPAEDPAAYEVVDVPFGGTVWWPYLDLGQPGVTKRMRGVDVIASGSPSISIGYDQRNLALFTPPYAIPADTLPGGIIPLPVASPTFSVRVDFAPGERWSLQAVNVFLVDNRPAV